MKGHPIIYSSREISWLERNRTLPICEYHAAFCEEFKRADVSAINLHSLRKRKGWRTGRTGCFVKGQQPPNKGKRCAPGTGGRHPNARKTQFKKGGMSGRARALYKPIGTERLCKDGYLERKIHDGLPLQSRWRAVHLIEWEAVNGPVPEGYALKCLDSNRLNTAPSNWEAVPRALLPRLNGGVRKKRIAYDDAPAELKPTIMAVAKLEQRVHEQSNAGVRRMTPTPSKPDLVALADESAQLPASDVALEMMRIKNLFDQNNGDKEDLASYAKSIVALRLASQSSSYEAGLRVPGWRAVPIEPTTVQANAGVDADDMRTGYETVKHIYRRMVAEAPPLPADGGEVDYDTNDPMGVERDIQSSDGGVESRVAPLETRAALVGETEIGRTTAEQPEKMLRSESRLVPPSRIAGVAPGPSEATPSTAGSVREALERVRRRAVACMSCGRPVGEHSMDTADVCNTFIGQEQPQYRCAICGFVIDSRYEATKPTIEFGMAGRAKTATPRPLPSVEQIALAYMVAVYGDHHAHILKGNNGPTWNDTCKGATAILTLLGGSAHG